MRTDDYSSLGYYRFFCGEPVITLSESRNDWYLFISGSLHETPWDNRDGVYESFDSYSFSYLVYSICMIYSDYVPQEEEWNRLAYIMGFKVSTFKDLIEELNLKGSRS